MADKRITQIGTTYDRDTYARTTDYLIGDRSGGSSFKILAEEAVLGALEDVTSNVGIGTASPGVKLDVSGNIRANGTLYVNSTADGTIIEAGGATKSNQFQFLTTTYPRFAIHDVDTGNDVRGPYVYIGRNSNSTGPAPGFLFVQQQNGSNVRSLYPDNSGVWRTLTTAPTSSNYTTGTVIGAQTSMAAAKNIYPDLSSLADVTERIRAGAEAVRRFAYKSGAFNGQEFEGVVVDDAPEYGMDRDAEHPAGKSLNEIQVIGDLLRMVADLSRRVAELETK